MSKNLRPLFGWRRAICQSELEPTTRHVLLALSLYMNEMGSSCFPTQQQLCKDTGLSESSVRRSLKEACKNGWLQRKLHGFAGQRWKNYEYEAAIPIGSVRYKGPVTDAGASKKDRSHRPEGPVTEDNKDRSQVPPNSSVNSSITLQQVDEQKLKRVGHHIENLKKSLKH